MHGLDEDLVARATEPLELVDVDLQRLLDLHCSTAAAATTGTGSAS